MKRVIKFRVWDVLQKSFIYSDKGYQGHYMLTLDGKFHNLQNGSGGDEYVVQQYIGLVDRKGREIYEGDIVKTDVVDEVVPPNDGRTITAKIVWDVYYAGWQVEIQPEAHLLNGEKYPFGANDNCYIDHLELDKLDALVIGNILENPELLK